MHKNSLMNQTLTPILKKYDNILPLTERQLVKDQTDKLVKETMKTINNINKAGIDERDKLLKALNRVSETLEADSCASICKSLKEDLEFNQRLLKAAEGYIQNSIKLTEISNSLQAINLSSFHKRISNIENTQVTMKSDISLIKGMVIKMLQSFKGMSSSTL
ncbi:hypothetical protein Tco_1439759 [Tanacetum coccineum]